jgi:hypothetical protein
MGAAVRQGDRTMKRSKVIFLVLVPLGLILIASLWALHQKLDFSSDRLILLLPDGMNVSDPQVTMWFDAASEEGLHLVAVHDSEFVRPLFRDAEGAGVILPDSFHQRASDIFIASVRRFVVEGGRLMLVYDAGTLLPNGRYPEHESRLSELAGISYALYDTSGDKTMRWGPIKGPNTFFNELGVPPGKYYPFHSEPVVDSGELPQTPTSFETTLRRYEYGDLEYPSFVTSGEYAGNVLLHSDAGVVAGEHSFKKGSVLFINLPVGSLKGKTDGLMLHGFLKYFALHTLGLPRMLSVPDGVGGLVLNWHVDSNAAIKPMQELESWGLLKQGPYSVHITAGPDAAVPGDHGGFDVANNAVGQQLIRQYLSLGYTIGSHGGWIHNYFASHVDKDDPKSLEKYLALNKEALEKVTAQPVVEYSAPDGNQPVWVTHWLDAHGFVAYYFTGDSGMGPTQGYRSGTRESKNLWAFPILHLDRAASFEEMGDEGYTTDEVEQWLSAITHFAIDQHLVRLVYLHPPGILPYRDAVGRWLLLTGSAADQHTFRWYTMTQIANFLNDRKDVGWKTTEKNGVLTIEASHPRNLAHFAWQLPAARYSAPEIVKGDGMVRNDGSAWIVDVQSGDELEFQSRILQ